MGRARPAAVLCVRGDAEPPRRRRFPGETPLAGDGRCRLGAAGRRLCVWACIPARGPHGTSGPIQRGGRDVTQAGPTVPGRGIPCGVVPRLISPAHAWVGAVLINGGTTR